MPKQIWIETQFSFEAAHMLPNHPGKCRNCHGHNFLVSVAFLGEVDQSTGMVLDFGVIKDILNPIFERLDHAFLSSPGVPTELIQALQHCNSKIVYFDTYPTAENLAQFLLERVADKLPNRIVRVTVWENNSSWAQISNEVD